MNKSADRLGLVVVWADRPQIGRYGYLAPLERAGSAVVMYFDETRLANPTEPIAEGMLVAFQTEKDETDRSRSVDIRAARFLADDPRFDFSADDIRFWPTLAARLKKPRDPISKYLSEQLSPETRQLLERYHGYGFKSQLPPQLASELNRIIRAPLVFEKERFAKIKLRRQTQLLLDRNPQGGELRLLNRLLLEDAYPKELGATPPYVDCSAPVVQALVLKRDTDDRLGWLELAKGNAYFYFDVFPSDSAVPQPGATVQCRVAETFEGFQAYDVWAVPAPVKAPGRPPGGAAPSEITRQDRPPALDNLQRPVERTQNVQPRLHQGRPEHRVSKLPRHLRRNFGPRQPAETPLPSSKTATAKPSTGARKRATNKSELLRSGFWFDVPAGKIVRPNGTSVKVSTRYLEVLSALFKKTGSFSTRVSSLKFATVAELWELGKLLERELGLDRDRDKKAIAEKLKSVRAQIKTDAEEAKRLAREWRRQFGRWLRDSAGIDDKTAIKVSSKNGYYYLGPGWDEKQAVRGDAEAGLVNRREQDEDS